MRELLSIIPNRTSDSSSAELEFLEEKEKDLAYLIKCVADLTARVDDQCMLVIRFLILSTSTVHSLLIDQKPSRTGSNTTDVYIDIHSDDLCTSLVRYSEDPVWNFAKILANALPRGYSACKLLTQHFFSTTGHQVPRALHQRQR